MRKKMLISLALVIIMMFNCFAPLMQVQASTVEKITLNNALYNAVKSALTSQNVDFKYDDNACTLEIDSSVLATITEMNLNEKQIYNLEGLEKFSSLTRVELSGNNLSEESNLESLAGLNLNYLDLSTNQIGDVSAINDLISNIQNNNGTVILTSQTVTNAFIFENNGDEEVKVQLPLILEKAGFIKSVWMKQSYLSQSTIGHPYITELPDRVSAENQEITVNIQNNGLLKLEIKIVDSSTEAAAAANKNPASKNVLKDSIFTTYVVVHDQDSTGIYIPDENLYNEIKKQISAGQLVNSELESYPYEVDINNEIVYEECTYTTNSANNLLELTVVNDTGIKYYIDTKTNVLYDAWNQVLNTKFEKTTIKIIDNNGNITYKEGYKVAVQGENRNLYKRAYDEAQVLVISDKDLMNKITSLILNNKQIRDLTGIEKFVGLKSDLNVSHNYLSNINPIYELQENKDIYEKELQEKYNGILKSNKNNLSSSLDATVSAKEQADSNINNISNTVKEILVKFEEAAKILKYTTVTEEVTDENGNKTTTEKTVENENYATEIAAKAEEIKALVKTINGYTETDTVTGKTTEVKGYLDLLDEALENNAKNLESVYERLSELYDTYNNEYKLLTLLADEVNYLDLEEYVTYNQKLKTKEGKLELLGAQVNYISNLINNDMLTEFEKLLIAAASGLEISFEEENSFAAYFEDLEELEDAPEVWLERFRQIAIYSEMANYCLIERMEDAGNEFCYVEEYLLNRIKDFQMEGIDTSVEEAILSFVREEEIGDNLFDTYKDYSGQKLVYSDRNFKRYIYKCSEYYNKIISLNKEASYFRNYSEILNLLVNVDSNTYPEKEENVQKVYDLLGEQIINSIALYETIEDLYDSNLNELYLYNEAIILSKRLVNGNVERYVTLPDLKKLDVSYNSYLEGIERLGELSELRELYANANYLTNIEQVNWEALKYLRKLGLAYNYITDITPLEVLENIVDLDVSHNLISGEFDFDFENSQKTLKNFNVSHNQLEDITKILEYLDRKSNGNFANYLAREDTINIDLGYQTIVMDIENPILLNENPTTINVDLPIIFVQLLAIDAERTSLGNTSLDGRIESEGRYVTINTRTAGNKTGEVEILAMPNAETCVGIGTKAIINYTVGEKTAKSIKINEEIAEIEKGTSATFTATVEGEYLADEDKAVIWSVEGAQNEGTLIDENGVLTVATEETAETIKIVATSNFNAALKAEKDIKLFAKAVTAVKINEEIAEMEKGTTATFTATVEGEYLADEDKAVTWSIKETVAEGTTIDENGLLTVSADETVETLTIVATSNYNNEIFAEKAIAVFAKTVSEVVIIPEATTVKPGTTTIFTAEVNGEYLTDEDKTVTWSVYGNTTPYTMINSTTGELTIAENENAETLIVSATSNFDETKVATAEVKLVVVKSVTVESESNKLNNGGRMTLTANVEGTNLTDAEKEVTWEVSGANDTKTMISTDGVLVIGADETADKVVVKATSVTNPSIYGTKEVEIAIPLPNLGYDLDENDETLIIGVSPSTEASEFKSKLVTDDKYTVVVKRNGEEISDTTNVATGDIAVIYSGDKVVEVYEIVVKGDVNGDGLADALDSSLIKAHRARLTTLTGSFVKAADIDNSGDIAVRDVRLLLYHRARIDGYIL